MLRIFLKNKKILWKQRRNETERTNGEYVKKEKKNGIKRDPIKGKNRKFDEIEHISK